MYFELFIQIYKIFFSRCSKFVWVFNFLNKLISLLWDLGIHNKVISVMIMVIKVVMDRGILVIDKEVMVIDREIMVIDKDIKVIDIGIMVRRVRMYKIQLDMVIMISVGMVMVMICGGVRVIIRGGVLNNQINQIFLKVLQKI
jgi:hypothetical protein